jgi:hypothetical protein
MGGASVNMDIIKYRSIRKKILVVMIASVVLTGLLSGYSSYFLFVSATVMLMTFLFFTNSSIPNDNNFKKTFFLMLAIVLLYMLKSIAEGGRLFVYLNSIFKYYGALVYYLYFCLVLNSFSIKERGDIYRKLLYLIAFIGVLSVFLEYFFSQFAMALPQYDGADPLAGRIYGFAGRPSVTAFILAIVMYSYFFVYPKKINLMTDVPLIVGFSYAFIMVGSGVGFFTVAFLSIVKFWRSRFLWVGGLVAFVVLLNDQIPQIEIFNRSVGMDQKGNYYINLLIDLKLLQIQYLLPDGISATGQANSYDAGMIGGDFAWPVFLGEVGVLGVFLMLISMSINTSRQNKILIILFILTSFHYATFFWGVPSLIFGLILAATRGGTNEYLVVTKRWL